jgi:CheY-like chemotaxis protein
LENSKTSQNVRFAVWEILKPNKVSGLFLCPTTNVIQVLQGRNLLVGIRSKIRRSGLYFRMPEKSKKITLVVDDNHDFADSLATLIKIYGCKVMVAYDTASGFKLAHESVPDIIFHDIGLPVMNGYDAARHFRSHQKFAKTILVAVTAYDATYDRNCAQMAGFDIHLSKPIDFEDLKEVLGRSRPHRIIAR